MYAEIHEEFIHILNTHTEQEIGTIIRTCVFCVDKTCAPRPGHIQLH